MNLAAKQCKFTSNFARLVLKAEELGYRLKVQEWNRDIETQRRYVAEGKSKTLDSKHLDKLAVDVVLYQLSDPVCGIPILGGEAFRNLGVYWESLGGRWGGRFGLEGKPKEVQDKELGWDCPHFEFKEG